MMKKMLTIMLALVMVLTAASALGESKINVSGSGEVRVSADTAVISLGVSARDTDVLKAQQRANETIAAIRKALTEHGVKEEDINTDFINIYPMYEYAGDQEKLTAYNASTTLAIRVTDMSAVGALIDVCFASGANTLNGITFSASDTAEAEAEAMKLAFADAKRKAEIYAESSGLKISGIELISEGGVYSFQNTIGNGYSGAKGMEEAAGMDADAGTVVQSAQLVVSASVSVTFTAE